MSEVKGMQTTILLVIINRPGVWSFIELILMLRNMRLLGHLTGFTICSFSTSGTDNEMVSSLPLQMSLYFNSYFFPLWWVSCIVMLHMKVSPPLPTARPWLLRSPVKVLKPSSTLCMLLDERLREHVLPFLFSIQSCLTTTSSLWSLSSSSWPWWKLSGCTWAAWGTCRRRWALPSSRAVLKTVKVSGN